MLANNKNFNNIKVHSQYSICEGAIRIDELADYCKSKKIKTIGLADSYNLCGALEFAEKLSKVGNLIYKPNIKYNQLKLLLKRDKNIDYIFCNPNRQGYLIDKEILEHSSIKLINTASTLSLIHI